MAAPRWHVFPTMYGVAAGVGANARCSATGRRSQRNAEVLAHTERGSTTTRPKSHACSAGSLAGTVMESLTAMICCSVMALSVLAEIPH
jgi:hypothetical protein